MDTLKPLAAFLHFARYQPFAAFGARCDQTRRRKTMEFSMAVATYSLTVIGPFIDDTNVCLMVDLEVSTLQTASLTRSIGSL